MSQAHCLKTQIKKKGEMEIFTISQLYSVMKKEYVEAEVEVIEICAEDIITESCQNPDPFAGSEGTEAV